MAKSMCWRCNLLLSKQSIAIIILVTDALRDRRWKTCHASVFIVLRRVNPSTTVWYSAPIKACVSGVPLAAKHGLPILVELWNFPTCKLLRNVYPITAAVFSDECAPGMRRVFRPNSNVRWTTNSIQKVWSIAIFLYFTFEFVDSYACVCLCVCMCVRVGVHVCVCCVKMYARAIERWIEAKALIFFVTVVLFDDVRNERIKLLQSTSK